MKASRCPTACAARMFAALTASVLLVQCAMPPHQAWQYIQTNGLFPYLSHSSPPFSSGSSYSQRYATSNAYPQRRSYNGYSDWSSGMPNRSQYSAASPSGYSPNRYFSIPSSGSGSSRYTPRSRSDSSSGDRSPAVKLPVEEPSESLRVANHPPSASSTPKTTGKASAPAPAPNAGDLPYGTAIPGRMNMVNSPYAGKTQLVDVSGMSAGQTVKCPYTGKLFKVPPTQQAANHAEPLRESKVEAPQLSDEPKTEDKKP
jgi:hypothetical protein